MSAARWVAALVLTAVLHAAAQSGPSPILLEQRQRELVLVRHLRQHVTDPGDGLALAADRRDLQRLRAGAPPAPAAPLTPTATDDELVDSIGSLADVWYVRLVDRQPFAAIPRARVASLHRVEQAVGQLQARGQRLGLDLWLQDVMAELTALVAAAGGQGPVQDASVHLALQLADAAAAGRPMLGPAPYPPACQTLRTSAGVSQSIADMVRAAECWTRTPTWPGWGEQTLEALDWAVSLAAAERNCQALGAAIDSVRELGPRLAGSGVAAAITRLAERAEADRRRLRAQSLCR